MFIFTKQTICTTLKCRETECLTISFKVSIKLKWSYFTPAPFQYFLCTKVFSNQLPSCLLNVTNGIKRV